MVLEIVKKYKKNIGKQYFSVRKKSANIKKNNEPKIKLKKYFKMKKNII